MPKSLTTHIDSPKAVGPRLREAREKAGLSQRRLAFPGCTAAYISRLEAGARVPSLQMIEQLALRLDVSIEWLAMGISPIYTYGSVGRFAGDKLNLHLRVEVFGNDERLAERAMDGSKFRLEQALLGNAANELDRWGNRFAQVDGESSGATCSRFDIGAWRLTVTGTLHASCGLPVEEALVIVADIVDEAGRQLYYQLRECLLPDAEARMFTILDEADPQAQRRELDAELAYI